MLDLIIFFTIAGIYIASSNELSVTTSFEQRGEHLVIITQVENKSNTPKKKALNIYVQDVSGNKRFVDMFDVKIKAGEIGERQTSTRINEIGPAPHKVVTEWK